METVIRHIKLSMTTLDDDNVIVRFEKLGHGEFLLKLLPTTLEAIIQKPEQNVVLSKDVALTMHLDVEVPKEWIF